MDSKIAIKQKSFFEIKKDILYLQTTFPFLKTKTLTHSTLGREIFLITIGEADEYVYFLPSFCGNVTTGSLLMLRFIEELAHALQIGGEIAGVNIRKATCGKGLCFIPIINPDGHEIAVKGFSAASYLHNIVYKNAETEHKGFEYNLRGVYLENNFYKCTVGSPYKNRFGGYAPFSEPESLALAELLRKRKPRHIVSFCGEDNNISFYKPLNDTRTPKMLEIINAIYPKMQIELTAPNTFGNWVRQEFYAPLFNLGIKNCELCGTINLYNELKELLTLMLIM